MEKIKKFFSIKEDKYTFEIWDLTSIITILNVALILMGFWWAPVFGDYKLHYLFNYEYYQQSTYQ